MNVIRYLGRFYAIADGAIVSEPAYLVDTPTGRKILRLSALLALV